MPDWVTHLGTTYLVAQGTLKVNTGVSRWLAWRHLLLGAVLPDTTRFTIVLVDILDWPAIPTFTYFIPFHSLLIVSILAGAIALLIPLGTQQIWSRAFGWLMIGAVFHFVLDEVDGLIGCGSTFLYPVYHGKLFSGWDSEGGFALFLLVVSAIVIGFALSQRAKWPKLSFCLTWQRLLGASGLVIIALLTPLLFQTWMIEQNAYYLGFVTHPASFQGQTVELCFSEVIETDPPTIEEFDLPFVLQTDQGFTLGEWVSVRGVYQDDVIQPTALIRHRSFSDLVLSLVAAVTLLFLLFDRRNIDDVLQWVAQFKSNY